MLPSRIIRQDAVSFASRTRSRFHDAFKSACPDIYERARTSGNPQRLGIGLSGGADSMTLLFLCHLLNTTHPRIPLDIKAFIVDHRAREESTDEAWTVKGWLWKLQIDTRILTIPWPSGTNPASLSNFETQARDHRYRLMGEACADMQIDHLLLGHHQDDWVETILMRLTQGAKGSGLKTFPASAEMISCVGIWGANRSGKLLDGDEYIASLAPGREDVPTRRIKNRGQLSFAEGGVRRYRPLLSYTKQDLFDICDFYRVPFKTDHSNFDPTLTKRNAVRHLSQNYRLPRALQPSSLLAMADKKQVQFDMIEKYSKKLLEATELLSFDLTSGVLEVAIPDFDKVLSSLNLARTARRMVYASYIRSLCSLVGPQDQPYTLREFDNTVGRLFPDLDGLYARHQLDRTFLSLKQQRSSLPPGASPLVSGPVRFTAARIIFDVDNKPGGTSNELPRPVWRLSCQPFFRVRIPDYTYYFGSLAPNADTGWFLWGGRFWIRLFNASMTRTFPNLAIRPLETEDIPELKQSVKRRSLVKGILSVVGPDALRTIPLVVQMDSPPPRNTYTIPPGHRKPDDADSDFGADATPFASLDHERIVGLPTINFKAEMEGPVKYPITWQVAYRKIDREVLKSLLSMPRNDSSLPRMAGRWSS